MKRISLLSILTGLLLLASITITFAWYVSGVFVTTPMIQSEDIEGLDLYLYRGFDYDFNGLLDSREFDDYTSEELNQLKNDLNDKFIYMNTANYDSITGIMDNNVITYRLRVVNNTDKEYNMNPYFIFYEDGVSRFSKYNSILFNLRDINIYNHTFCNKNGEFINYFGDNNTHFNTSTRSYYEVKISTSDGDINGLYDSYGNPIELISDGNTYYRLEYDQNKVFTHIYHEDELTDYDGTINLSEFYNSMLYKADGDILDEYPIYDDLSPVSLYDTYYSNNNYLYNMEYNTYNKNGIVKNIIEVNEAGIYAKDYYPSRKINRGINLSLLMYQENATEYETDIAIDSYSEYYIDFHIEVSSDISSIQSALSEFASLHNINTSTVATTPNPNKYEVAYNHMYDKFSELIRYSEISSPSFKITSFCFDMILKNGKSSYIKRKSGDES